MIWTGICHLFRLPAIDNSSILRLSNIYSKRGTQLNAFPKDGTLLCTALPAKDQCNIFFCWVRNLTQTKQLKSWCTTSAPSCCWRTGRQKHHTSGCVAEMKRLSFEVMMSSIFFFKKRSEEERKTDTRSWFHRWDEGMEACTAWNLGG